MGKWLKTAKIIKFQAMLMMTTMMMLMIDHDEYDFDCYDDDIDCNNDKSRAGQGTCRS